MNAITTADVARLGAQVLIVVALAAAGAALLNPSARVRFVYWWIVIAVCVALPLVPRVFAIPAAAAIVATASASVPAAPRIDVATDSALRWVPVLCLAGIALRGAWIVLGLLRLRALRVSSRPASLDRRAAAAARAIAPAVELRSHPRVAQPVAFGWRRPVILLPPRFADLPADVQEAVIIHEALHVARRDWLLLLLEQSVQALFWFHPAMWWAVDRVQLAREQMVDAAVVDQLEDRHAYLVALFTCADAAPSVAMATPFVRSRHLITRARAIARPRRVPAWQVTLGALGLAVVLSLSTAAAASLLPLQDETVYTSKDAGVSLPVVIKEERPNYTPEAMKERIQGAVVLETVVTTDGTPSKIRIVESLDARYGLDDAAVAALKQWRFKPGRKDGRDVAVRVEVRMAFTLK